MTKAYGIQLELDSGEAQLVMDALHEKRDRSVEQGETAELSRLIEYLQIQNS